MVDWKEPHNCRFACLQRVLKTFPDPICLRSEDGIVWPWHFFINLNISIYLYLYLFICIFIYLHIYISMYLYIYIYIYILETMSHLRHRVFWLTQNWFRCCCFSTIHTYTYIYLHTYTYIYIYKVPTRTDSQYFEN